MQGLVLFSNKLYPQSAVIIVCQLSADQCWCPHLCPGVGCRCPDYPYCAPPVDGGHTMPPHIPMATLHNITMAALHLTMMLISHHLSSESCFLHQVYYMLIGAPVPGAVGPVYPVISFTSHVSPSLAQGRSWAVIFMRPPNI